MWSWVLWTIVSLVALVLSVALALVLTMRTKHPRALVVVRGFNRRLNNPRALRRAGRPGAELSVLRHVGRSSGKPYETPIGVYPLEEGYLVNLSYGQETDWLRNIRAAGTAELVVDGQSHQVSAARVIGLTEATPHLFPRHTFLVRLLGVTEFLVLQRVPVTSSDGR
ncbi:nitroreductase family deazaflavin-dependent oxidoreductase [Promicromonospora sp. NPDC052451]|uniref:nitroreductase family deazaflavin-dependent oxidoreductase n=1 Tax=Promicromonospora sp. NPDC052451 TaxID=3364407 RepID=UPI0037C5DC66